MDYVQVYSDNMEITMKRGPCVKYPEDGRSLEFNEKLGEI